MEKLRGGWHMCGFAGFFNPYADFLLKQKEQERTLKNMCKVLYHRGPDEQGCLLAKHFGLAHTRLAIIDLKNGTQPMTAIYNENRYSIVYNGELYNTQELRKELERRGKQFQTTSDTEVILQGFIEYGIEIVDKLNGIFAFCVVDEEKEECYIVRDQVGVKPLYFSMHEETLVFSSELKGIFEFPGIRPSIGLNGLNEVLSLGPAKSYGSGVFENVQEVKPGYYLKYSKDGSMERCYWKVTAMEHTDNYEETVAYTKYLVTDAIERQMVSDVPIATFLSGGVDSSIVSAVCAEGLKKSGSRLGTFSFDFRDNDKHFQANAFQPSQDRPYVDIMVQAIDSEHRYLECNNEDLFQNLFASVDVRDLPTMADVDSSMLYFCSLVKPYYKVVLTGECADEIFGGYPWFHKEECFQADTFPWSMDLTPRKSLLKDEIVAELHMDEYVKAQYQRTIEETPRLEGEDLHEARRREISYLNMKWFMQTLLDRMDRTSMYSGLEARVPFADIRIIQYLYNVPWEMKCRNGVEKSLLREAMGDVLPKEILHRKKSPYPKTYDPAYEQKLAKALLAVMEDTSAPLHQLVDKQKVYAFIQEKKDYGRPWYGQLMAGPQMLAYLLQINYWLGKYHLAI